MMCNCNVSKTFVTQYYKVNQKSNVLKFNIWLDIMFDIEGVWFEGIHITPKSQYLDSWECDV